MSRSSDVLIIGAGPAGAVAAALMLKNGFSVTVIEREVFPRFAIGESLLPYCMNFLEEAGMLDAVALQKYQFKDGAVFARGVEQTVFNFTEKYSKGPATTYQVLRSDFDLVLAERAMAAGADITYGRTTESVDFDSEGVTLKAKVSSGEYEEYRARFLFDASGFGRVLPRLLQLESPSEFPVRRALFTHIQDNITDPDYDRDKILISVHPELPGVWYWLIPFSDGRCSIGVVLPEDSCATEHSSNLDELRHWVSQCPNLEGLLKDAQFDSDSRVMTGYSANVSTLAGQNFALLGNAGEFLDPIFSSGVTIALKSASMASACLTRQLQGESVDWQAEYEIPLRRGIAVFRHYVEAWYDGGFQDIVFYRTPDTDIKAMVCSVLAGYAWDESNPYTQRLNRRLKTLATICASS